MEASLGRLYPDPVTGIEIRLENVLGIGINLLHLDPLGRCGKGIVDKDLYDGLI